MRNPQDLDLAAALRELAARHGPTTSYNQLWRFIVAGRIPAHRQGREWRIRKADLPKVAVALGLTDAGRAA